MSTMIINKKLYEAVGNDAVGYINEIRPDGIEVQISDNYSCYEEAEEALLAMVFTQFAIIH